VAAIITKEKEKLKLQRLTKSGYWKNELCSLGVVEPNRWKELNDDKEELEYLADSIKQAMFEDYKLAYSEKGDEHREEAESTLTVG